MCCSSAISLCYALGRAISELLGISSLAFPSSSTSPPPCVNNVFLCLKPSVSSQSPKSASYFITDFPSGLFLLLHPFAAAVVLFYVFF